MTTMRQTRNATWPKWIPVLLLAAVPLLAGGRRGDDNGGDKPRKRPKVNKVYIEQARKSKSMREIVALHDGIREAYAELTNLKALEEPREARKAKRKIARLEARIQRDRKKLEKLVAQKAKPLKKIYRKNKAKLDDYTARAKKHEAQGKTDKALQLHQQAAKFSGPAESAKRKIDILEWFLFFDDEE
jgi:hypothetical protein